MLVSSVILRWQCVCRLLSLMVPFLISSGLVSYWSDDNSRSRGGKSPWYIKCNNCWWLFWKRVNSFVFENNLIGRSLFLLWQGNVYVVGGAPWNTKVWTREPPLSYSFEPHHHHLCIYIQRMKIKQELTPNFKMITFISDKESCLLASFIFFAGNRIWLWLFLSKSCYGNNCFQTGIKSGLKILRK